MICHVAVTRNLVRRNMRCDKYCPRCGEPEESVTHDIFECSLALQAWSLSTTPTSPNIFLVPSIYAISFAEKQHCQTRTRHRSLSLDNLAFLKGLENKLFRAFPMVHQNEGKHQKMREIHLQ